MTAPTKRVPPTPTKVSKRSMARITSLADFMTYIDYRLSKLRISRSSTQNFPGIRGELVNNWWGGRAADMNGTSMLALAAGVGCEIWIRTLPRTATERIKFDAEFAAWMAEGGLVLEPDSEVQVTQRFPEGVVGRRAARGIVEDPYED